MTATHHIEDPLRPGATDLAQFVSDYCQLEPPHRPRDIAIQYLDQNVAEGTSTARFNELVKHFTKQVRFYL